MNKLELNKRYGVRPRERRLKTDIMKRRRVIFNDETKKDKKNERSLKMAKKKDISKSITKVNPAQQLPEFMEDEEILGLEILTQYIIPPFIKIVQKSAADELLQYFSAGDVILSPANATIAEMPRNSKGRVIEGAHSMFQIVPILFYPEWLTWNAIELKGSEPAILYRTQNPNDPVVAKARSPQLRTEQHPRQKEFKIRHVEHLNFVAILYKHPIGLEPAILSFSRGEWKSGTKFAGLVKMRYAPIYGCVFDAVVALRHGAKGDWYGFDMCNPEDGSPWVDEADFEMFKKIHEQFAKYYAEQKLQAQYEVVVERDDAETKASDEF